MNNLTRWTVPVAAQAWEGEGNLSGEERIPGKIGSQREALKGLFENPEIENRDLGNFLMNVITSANRELLLKDLVMSGATREKASAVAAYARSIDFPEPWLTMGSAPPVGPFTVGPRSFTGEPRFSIGQMREILGDSDSDSD